MKNKHIAILITALIIVSISAVIVYQKIYGKRYISTSISVSSTILNLTADMDKKSFDAIVDNILLEIARVDLIVNPYNKDSEISKINNSIKEGNTDNMYLSDELAYLLETGKYYSSISGGHFDVTVRSLIELWGFGIKDNQTVPTSSDIDKALKDTGYKYFSIKTNVDDTKTLSVEKKVSFDMGSYAKGYIIGRIANVFFENGVDNFLIDFGGDSYSYGLNKKGKPWVIAIKKPRNEIEGKYLGVLYATNSTIVTSGDYERLFTENGTNYHHIIDAVSGYPSRNAISSTVVSDDPMHADALSTMSFLLGTNFFTNENLRYSECYMVVERGDEVSLIIHTNESFSVK